MANEHKKSAVNSAKAIRRTLILTAAYLMEEDGWNSEKLIDFFNSICEWSNAIKDHTISIRKVVELIQDKTGDTSIKW